MNWFILIFTVASLWAQGSEDNIRFQLAKQYEKTSNYDRALGEYRAFLVEFPNSEDGYIALGRVYQKKNAISTAAKQYQKALDINPKSPEGLKSLAKVRESQQKTEKAIGLYRKLANASIKDKEFAEAKISNLMKVKARQGNKNQKVGSLTQESSVYSSDLFAKARMLTDKGQDKKALKLWRKVLKKNPGNPGAYYFAGVNRYNLKDYDNARINFSKSKSYPEKGFNASYYLGRIAEKKNKPKEAIKNYKDYLKKTTHAPGKKEVESRIKRLSKTPSNPLAKQDSDKPDAKDGSEAADSNEVSKAPKLSGKNAPDKVMTLNTGLFFALQDKEARGTDEINKAWSKYSRSKIDDAIDILKEIFRDMPASPNALAAQYNLASIYLELGLGKRVINTGRMILRNNPPEPYLSSIKYLIAKAEFEVGSKKKSLELIKQVKIGGALGPNGADKLGFEAELAKQLDQGEVGIEKLKLAIKNAKTTEKKRLLKYDLSSILLEKKKVEEAIGIYKDIISQCEKGTTDEICRRAFVGVADENFKLKKWDISEKFYKQVLKEFKDPSDSPWAQYQLGNIFAQQKKFDKAVKNYNLVSEKYSESYWASQAQWKREDAIWRKEYEGVLSK